MIRHSAVAAIFLAVIGLCCGGSNPAAPSQLKDDTDIGGTNVRVPLVRFTRDFMPIQAKPGPDGGGPLQGAVFLWLEHHGPAVDITLAVSIYAESGAVRYPVVAVAHDYEAENDPLKVPTFWGGHIGPLQKVTVELQLSDGPYLPAGSRAFAVIDVSDSEGHKGSLRSPTVAIGRTD